jgi:hypothetical protein
MADPQIPLPSLPEADDDDNDSSLGLELASSTTSIGSSILKYREENGRTYHAYKVRHNLRERKYTLRDSS